MTDEAFVFNQTVRERKATGYGAYHKNRKGGRTIRFPSDNLSRRERQQMNGEVVSFDPRKFYTAEEFSTLPPEHKATLINGYIGRYDVGLSNISEIVFGKSKTWLYCVLNKSGILPMIHIQNGRCKEKAKLALKADCEAYRGGEDMTGMEAWHIVAPLIAAHSVATYTASGSPSLNALDEAYIIVFGALKEHDEKRKEKRTCRNCKHCQDWAIVGFEDEPCASCLKAKKCFTKWEAREWSYQV